MPDRDALRRTLIELLEADTGEKYPHLDDAANLREGLGLDSVDVVSIVSQIERQYRIRLTHQELESIVASLVSSPLPPSPELAPALEIPVCYDGDLAPDLTSVAHHTSLTTEQVIALHSGGDYFVYFLGFSPGFAYLGGVPRQLQVPRLASPRKHVSAGSVGLAGGQTGIYPHDSPGGWQLVGRTPLRMFVPSANPPSCLQFGDQVLFRRITRDEFDRLANEQTSRP